jgi:hypothetical protein
MTAPLAAGFGPTVCLDSIHKGATGVLPGQS